VPRPSRPAPPARHAGIELDIGREAEAHPLFTEAGLAALQAALARTGLVVPSICLGALNAFGFKSADPAERSRVHFKDPEVGPERGQAAERRPACRSASRRLFTGTRAGRDGR
jgi:hypothetical protein